MCDLAVWRKRAVWRTWRTSPPRGAPPLSRRASQVSRLKTRISDLRSRISDLGTQNAKLKTQVASAPRGAPPLSHRASQVSRLKTRISDLRSQVSGLGSRNSKRKTQNSKLMVRSASAKGHADVVPHAARLTNAKQLNSANMFFMRACTSRLRACVSLSLSVLLVHTKQTQPRRCCTPCRWCSRC